MDVAMIFVAFVVGWGVVAVTNVNVGLCGVVWWLLLILSLLSAQMGYLHLCKAQFMYSYSLRSNCWSEQTVLALCERVLTLCLCQQLTTLGRYVVLHQKLGVIPFGTRCYSSYSQCAICGKYKF